jgi:hypothetical protein
MSRCRYGMAGGEPTATVILSRVAGFGPAEGTLAAGEGDGEGEGEGEGDGEAAAFGASVGLGGAVGLGVAVGAQPAMTRLAATKAIRDTTGSLQFREEKRSRPTKTR